MFEKFSKKHVRTLSYELADNLISCAELTFSDENSEFPKANINSKASVFSAKMNVNMQFQDLFFAIYMADLKSISLNIDSKNAAAVLSVVKSLCAHPLPNKLKLLFKGNVSVDAMNILADSVKRSESLQNLYVDKIVNDDCSLFFKLGCAIASNENINAAYYPGIGDYLKFILDQRNVNVLRQVVSNVMVNVNISLPSVALCTTVAMPSENESVGPENTKSYIVPVCGIIGDSVKNVAKKVLMDVTNMQDASCISM